MADVVGSLDASDFDAWYDVYAAANDRGFDAPWLRRELRVILEPDEYTDSRAYVARRDGRIVGGAFVELPLKDNPTAAYGHVFVAEEHRRAGIGSRLLEAVRAECAAVGRSRLFLEALRSADEPTSPATLFLERHGFTLALTEAIRQLDLPAEPPAAPVADAYTLTSWRDGCPDELLDEYAALRARMNSEAPMGTTALGEEFWDAARVRSDEDDMRESGRLMQVVVARHASGELAGHTQLVFPDHPDDVYQWDTLVLRDHRGHGLGMSLKVEAMRASADLLAGRRRILTYNAETNAPMIAVNERLGFRLTAVMGEYVSDVLTS